MSHWDRSRFIKLSCFLVFLGMGFGSLFGHINALFDEKQNLEVNRDFKAISYDIREALSQDNGCTNALSTALIYPARKEMNKALHIDGFALPSGEQLLIGRVIKKYNVRLESMSIRNLNSIGKNSDGYQVFTAELDGTFAATNVYRKRVRRTLANLLVTLDNRDRLVQCSNKFSGDAIKIMVSLCAGSQKIYDRKSGHCHSPKELAARQQRAVSSVK